LWKQKAVIETNLALTFSRGASAPLPVPAGANEVQLFEYQILTSFKKFKKYKKFIIFLELILRQELAEITYSC